MMMAVYGILCMMLGGITGAFIGAKFDRRRDVAPTPVDLSYDTQNRVNGAYNAKHGECVMICGKEMWRM